MQTKCPSCAEADLDVTRRLRVAAWWRFLDPRYDQLKELDSGIRVLAPKMRIRCAGGGGGIRI